MNWPTRKALLIFALMLVASSGAFLARPDTMFTDVRGMTTLEAMIPRQIGDWHDEPQWMTQIVDPVLQEAVDAIYDQTLARTYANADGYRIMLSVAYDTDHRRRSGVHRPELCYPGQGFTVHSLAQSQLSTPFGSIPVQRMFAARGERVEPVTSWVTVGDKVVTNELQLRLVELSYTLKGVIPDGLVFRVSSIDHDQVRASRLQDEFIVQLLSTVSGSARKQLGGFGKD